MKVCLLHQRRFAYVAHDIAYWLKEKYGVTEFCGYVYLRWSYNWLKTQTEIPYTNLLLDEDVHKQYANEKIDLKYLAELEEKYGLPNLWPYIALDRVVMSNQVVREYPYDQPAYTHEEMIKIFQVKARAIINFLETEKPDAILFPNIGGIGAYLLWTVAKKMGIKTFDLLPACTQNRYVLSEKFDYFTGVEEKFANNQAAGAPEKYLRQAEQFLNEFRNKPAPYHPDVELATKKMSRTSQLKFLRPANLLRSVSWFGQVIGHFARDAKNHDYSNDMHPWYYLVDRIKRKTRNFIGLSDLYDECRPDDEDYAFFPLHLDPEIATLLQAPFYTDQVNLIRQISRSLPLHFKLYVKEHPLMVDYRPRSFYREIKKNPNVKLINPKILGINLVQKAKLITAITSTSAWEGVLLKKPVINFGDQFYNALSMVTKCTEIQRLPYLVKEKLKHFDCDDQELLNYLSAIFEDSIPLDLRQAWEKETDEIKRRQAVLPLTELLATKLNLKSIL